MLFIINADGTVQTTFPSQVYQGSNAASDIIVVAPWVAGAAITVSFELPNGARTTPSLITPQEAPITLDGVEYRAWRALLPYAITQYAGTVTAQFSIYTGTQTVTSSAATFDVYEGAVPLPPSETGADVYQQILAALGAVDTKYVSVEGRVASLENGLAGETDARESADAALGQRVDSVESGLTSEAAARQTADTALGNRIDAVEVDIDGKVDKVQAGTNYKVYGVQPANAGGAQTSIDATEFATKGNTIVMRDPNGGFYVKDPVYDSQPVNLRTQTSAINAAKTEVKDYVDEKVSQFDIITIVSELPTTGEPNRLYLVTKTGGTSGDLFDEYVWEEGEWERVGSASIDLSGYATTEALESGLAEKLPIYKGNVGGIKVYIQRKEGITTVPDMIDAQYGAVVGVALRGPNGVLDVGTPTADTHATTKAYVDDGLASKITRKSVTGGIKFYAETAQGPEMMHGQYGALTGVALRGPNGDLDVGTPTAANHATTKQYVDAKCVVYDISLGSEAWVERPVSGAPGEDDAWSINLSDVGIQDNPKFIAWTFHNEGYESAPTGFESANGTNAYPNAQPNNTGAKVQIAEGELIILGATSPSSTSFGTRQMNLVVFY